MAKRQKPNQGKIAQPSYMKKDEFKSVCKRLGLKSINEIAEFLKVHPRTVSRWLSGESPIDARTTMLLEHLDE